MLPMQSLQNILGKCIREFGIEGAVVLKTIKNQWVNIVGETIAMHTFPDTIKSNILTLIVDTPQWMHHLSFFKEEISEKLKHYNVSGIRFRLGRLPEKKGRVYRSETIELSDEEMDYIDNTLRNLKDEDIREKFRTLMKHGLTKGKRKH